MEGTKYCDKKLELVVVTVKLGVGMGSVTPVLVLPVMDLVGVLVEGIGKKSRSR